MTSTRVETVIADALPQLLAYFIRRVDHRDDAADLLGATLESAWKASRRMPHDPVEARMWLFGVARNSLLHHHRTVRRRDALVVRLGRSIESTEHNGDSDALDVRAAVAALPTDLGELIRLIHWDGFTFEQASSHLGVSASTLRTRHARAKQLLQAALTESDILA